MTGIALLLVLLLNVDVAGSSTVMMAKNTYSDPVLKSHYRQRLERAGYNPDNPESVLEALENPKPNVRCQAMKYLGGTQGEKAVPALAKMVNDPDIDCRCLAARLLAIFGQKSGLARIREDYQTLLPPVRQKMEAIDSDIELSPEEKLQARCRKEFLHGLRDALNCAKVLSEFGDPIGYELAVEVAMDTGYSYASRCEAVHILGEIWNMDATILQAENRQPQVILLTLAETDSDANVLRNLRDIAIVQKNLAAGTALYEKLIQSAHVSEKFRADTQRQLEGYKEHRKHKDSAKHEEHKKEK